MPRTKFLIAALVATFPVGCSAKWVKLDNSTAESALITEAKTKCRVEDRLYQLSYQELATKAAINSVTDKASKEDLRQGFETKREKVNQEIESCMHAEGLKPGS